MTALRLAVGFLTRIPVGDPSRAGTRPVELARAVPWFPIVGSLIGALAAVAWSAINLTNASPFVAASVAVSVGLLITGAFHHDGLADIADAFGGGWNPDQRFEILKDSRLGTYGTTALVCAIGVEIAALATLTPNRGVGALVAAHAIGRALAVIVMKTAPVARSGLGADYAGGLTIAHIAAALAGAGLVIVAAVAATDLSATHALSACVAATTATVLVVVLSIRKIGGIVGDVLGAVAVIATVCSLAAISMW